MANRRNSLGIRKEDLDAMVRKWEAQMASGGTQRTFRRLRHLNDRVYIKVKQSGSPDMILKMACKDLSAGGMSLLHNAYLHPGSECTVVLEHRMEGPRTIDGRIVRCEHRMGVVHEIGIQFNTPIILADFVGDTSPDEILSFENVDPQALEGVVLVIDPSPTDFALIQHYLKETRVRLRHAPSIEQGEQMIRERVDVVILDLHIEDEQGAVLLDRLRSEGDETPVIATTLGLTRSMKPLIAALSNVRLLEKPVDEQTLLRALGEFMLQDTGSASMRVETDRIDSSVPRDLVTAFKNELRSMVTQIEQGMHEKDESQCRVASLRIAGSAPAVGLATIGSLARHAAERLQEKGVDEAAPDLQSLLEACKRHIAA